MVDKLNVMEKHILVDNLSVMLGFSFRETAAHSDCKQYNGE